MKTILPLLLMLISSSVFSQTEQPLTLRDSLLLKSKQQKTGGAVLMGVGIALTTTGLIINVVKTEDLLEGDVDYTAGIVLIAGGLLTMGGGIYMLAKSKENKKKAMNLSLDAGSIKVPVSGGWTNRLQPTLTLAINLSR